MSLLTSLRTFLRTPPHPNLSDQVAYLTDPTEGTVVHTYELHPDDSHHESVEEREARIEHIDTIVGRKHNQGGWLNA